MKNKSKFIIANIFLIVLVSMIFYYRKSVFESVKKDDQPAQESLEKVRQKIVDFWQKPDISQISRSKIAECFYQTKNLDLIHQEFYKCNGQFFNCLYPTSLLGYLIKSSLNRDHLPIVEIFKNGRFQQKILLQNTCQDTYLPQNVYSLGPKNYSKLVWDNYGQYFFIDKTYVSNLDVLIWKKKFKMENEDKLKQLEDDFFKPNTSLSMSERQKYCYDHKAQLLTSELFDAATFFQNIQGKSSYLQKFPYPWTRKSEVNLNDCFNIFSKDCKIGDSFYFKPISVSWIGISNALGGYMEYLPNSYLPNANLKVSSKEVSSLSFWHQVGYRGSWKENEVELMEQYTKKTEHQSVEEVGNEVAFRCYKIR